VSGTEKNALSEKQIHDIYGYFSRKNIKVEYIQVGNIDALQYTGDLYGILKAIKPTITIIELEIVRILNKYKNSQEYDGVETVFKFPLSEDVTNIARLII